MIFEKEIKELLPFLREARPNGTGGVDSSAVTEEDGRVGTLTKCSSNQFNLKSSSLFFEGRRIPFFSKRRRRIFKLPNFSSLAEEKFSPLYLKRGAFDVSYFVFCDI